MVSLVMANQFMRAMLSSTCLQYLTNKIISKKKIICIWSFKFNKQYMDISNVNMYGVQTFYLCIKSITIFILKVQSLYYVARSSFHGEVKFGVTMYVYVTTHNSYTF